MEQKILKLIKRSKAVKPSQKKPDSQRDQFWGLKNSQYYPVHVTDMDMPCAIFPSIQYNGISQYAVGLWYAFVLALGCKGFFLLDSHTHKKEIHKATKKSKIY